MEGNYVHIIYLHIHPQKYLYLKYSESLNF